MNIVRDIVPVDVSTDDAEFSPPMAGIRVVGEGVVVVKAPNGNTRTLPFLAGETRMVTISSILSEGTTATGIEALDINF